MTLQKEISDTFIQIEGMSQKTSPFKTHKAWELTKLAQIKLIMGDEKKAKALLEEAKEEIASRTRA